METKQQNFRDRPQSKKGEIGEIIIEDFLIKRGYVIYSTKQDKAHAFDRLAIKDKKTVMIAEIKSKAKRKKYPDTGIDLSSFNTYKNISEKHKLEVFLFFVDEEAREIYGNYLSELEKPITILDKKRSLNYPLIWDNIIYFPIAKMLHIKNLGVLEVEQLQKYTTKQGKYLPQNETKETPKPKPILNIFGTPPIPLNEL